MRRMKTATELCGRGGCPERLGQQRPRGPPRGWASAEPDAPRSVNGEGGDGNSCEAVQGLSDVGKQGPAAPGEEGAGGVPVLGVVGRGGEGVPCAASRLIPQNGQ